jgi:hypothetical protein
MSEIRLPFQSPLPSAMAVPAPLTVNLPPLHEEDDEACETPGDLIPQGPPIYGVLAPATLLMPICEMCGQRYEDRGDDLPYCGYACASGGGSGSCSHACPAEIGGCLDPDRCDCRCADCVYERLPLCDACGYRDATAEDYGICASCAANPQCDHCGVNVREPGLCDRCLRNFREEERWANEMCGDCRLKNRDCRCYEEDDCGRGHREEEPPGRRCPVCGDHFEGNDWGGVCSRSCASTATSAS